MITLKNPGLLEIDLITTMGAHVKESDNYLGRFGTGMKYAIAVLLRNGVKFDLCIGKNVYEFYTEKKTIRSKNFDICHMSGPYDVTPLGFTTEFGKNWQPWQAYRELYTNCVIDEDRGEFYKGEDNSAPYPEEDTTMFRIYDEIETDNVFIREMKPKLLFKNHTVEIYDGESNYLYYQGIRAKDLNRPSIYTYNIIESCSLTEDRSLSFDFQIYREIAHGIVSMGEQQKHLIEKILTAGQNHFESRLDFSEASYAEPSKSFVDVYRQLPDKKRNSTVTSFMSNWTPSTPKTMADKRREFIEAIECMIPDYQIDGYEINAEAKGKLVLTFSAEFFN